MNLFISILITFICMPWPGMIMMSPMMIAAPDFASKKSSIVLAMVFFIYPSLIFTILKLTGFAFYDTNPIWWAAATFVAGMVVSMLYGLPGKLYNVSRGISNYGYEITDKCVYFNGTKLKGADPETFTHFNNRGYYSKDKNQVYYNTQKLPDADADTFQPLANDDTNGYWHDAHNVYYKWNKIVAGADGASVVYAGNYYACDKTNVYFEDKRVSEADNGTFKSLTECIGRDAQNVFVRETPVKVKDINTFEIITLQEETFGKDKDHIYALRYIPPFPLMPFPDADSESFEVVGEYYAKDKKQVYYYSNHVDSIQILKQANPQNFILHFDATRGTDATDGTRFYKSGVLYTEQEGV
jgi:hypothetical protein